MDKIRTQSCSCHGFRDFSFKYIYFSSKSFCIKSFCINSFADDKKVRVYGIMHSSMMWEVVEGFKKPPEEIRAHTRSEYPEIVGGVYSKNMVTYTERNGRIITDILVDDGVLIQQINDLQLQAREIERKCQGYLSFLDATQKDENIWKKVEYLFLELPKYAVGERR